MEYVSPKPNTFFTGKAKWIWSTEGLGGRCPDPRPIQCRYFRRSFDCPAGAGGQLAISADTCYMLWVNGRLLTRGPQKGDVAHQFYDTLDLTDDLVEGTNTILVRVDCYAKTFSYTEPPAAPGSRMTAATVFVADGCIEDDYGEEILDLATDARWEVRIDDAVEFIPGVVPNFTGMNERVTLAGQTVAASDGWTPATVVHTAFTPENVNDGFLPHRLIPRSIKPLTLAPVEFSKILAADDGVELQEGTLLMRPAGGDTRALVELTALATAYPLATVSGKGEIRLTYAERLNEGNPDADQPTAAGLYGNADELVVDGSGTWTPIHWRTARYIEVRAAGDLQLTLALTDCHYPIEPAAPFRSSSKELNRMWAIGVRTQQACAHETYEDCPYYEQLQYAGDTQMQMLYTYAVSGDTSLPLQAIRAFHWSRIPDGLTQSRYPNRNTQVIPYWSLHYLFMLWDWYQYNGEAYTIAEEVFGADEVVRWFTRRIGRDNLIGPLQYWCVADWSPEWCRDFDGQVPGVKTGPTAITQFMVIYALDKLAVLFEELGDDSRAEDYRDTAAALRRAARTAFWDAGRGLFLDSLQHDVASQLTNAWAVLVDLADDADALAQRLADDESLCQAAYFGQFYLFEAWKKVDRQDLILSRLTPYYEMIRQGFTTWPEALNHGRSMCHAWSNAGSYQILNTILGFSILIPGCRELLIAPHLGDLQQISGGFATPRGPVRVSYRQEQGFTIELPHHIRAILRHGGRDIELSAGHHEVGAADFSG